MSGKSTYYTFVNSNGEFVLPVGIGQYTVQPIFINSFLYDTLCPVSGSYDVVITSQGQAADSLAFFFKPGAPANELSIDIVANNTFRFNRPVRYIITCKNQGNTRLQPHVEFNFPETMVLLQSSIVPDFSGETMLEWVLDTIGPGESELVFVDFELNNLILDIGDSIIVSGNVFPVFDDVVPENNVDTLTCVIIGAVDPNDKLVDPTGRGDLGEIPKNTEAFEYTIQFQNTGTDTAFSVVIVDTLDSKLDVSTLRILSSYPKDVQVIVRGNILEIEFPGILLPDSNTNYLASQGYFHFRIKPKETLREGEQIKNRALIFFDTEEPIATNEVLNTVEAISSVTESKENGIAEMDVFPNPTSGIIHGRVDIHHYEGEFMLYDALGREVPFEVLEFSESHFKIEIVENVPNGSYALVYRCNGCGSGFNKLVILKR